MARNERHGMIMQTRTTQLTVLPQGRPVYSEEATTVTIADEVGGEFVIVEQSGDGYGKIGIDRDEWPPIRDAIDKMVAACRSENEKGEME